MYAPRRDLKSVVRLRLLHPVSFESRRLRGRRIQANLQFSQANGGERSQPIRSASPQS